MKKIFEFPSLFADQKCPKVPNLQHPQCLTSVPRLHILHKPNPPKSLMARSCLGVHNPPPVKKRAQRLIRLRSSGYVDHVSCLANVSPCPPSSNVSPRSSVEGNYSRPFPITGVSQLPVSEATGFSTNNTYRTLRITEKGNDWMYGVWCTGERELYDMTVGDFLSILT